MLLLHRFINVKICNKEIPANPLTGNTFLYRLKFGFFDPQLIISNLQSQIELSYEFHMNENRHKRTDTELSFPLCLWAFMRGEVQ